MHRWYAVQTQPNAEAKAAFNLDRQDFQVYCPRYLKQRRHARRADTIARAVFPGYVFVGLDIETMRWRSIQSTFGVRRLISFGEMPTPVPTGIVESLQARENDAGLIVLGRDIEFKPGQSIQIVNGPFAEHDALFECMDDKERVTLLLNLMGRQVRMRVPLEAVRPLH